MKRITLNFMLDEYRYRAKEMQLMCTLNKPVLIPFEHASKIYIIEQNFNCTLNRHK